MPVAVAAQVETVHDCRWFWNFVRCNRLYSNCIECRALPNRRHLELYQLLAMEALYQ